MMRQYIFVLAPKWPQNTFSTFLNIFGFDKKSGESDPKIDGLSLKMAILDDLRAFWEWLECVLDVTPVRGNAATNSIDHHHWEHRS